MKLSLSNPRKILSTSDLHGHPEIKHFVQSPVGIPTNEGIRVFFCSRKEEDRLGQFVSRPFFADFSEDFSELLGVSTAPISLLGGLGSFDEFGQNPISVVQNGDSLWLYYAGWARPTTVPFTAWIGLLRSKDAGQTFVRAADGPVLGASVADPLLAGSPRVKRFRSGWFMWYSSGKDWIVHKGRAEPIYKISCARSQDGISWAPLGSQLITDVLGKNECQASPEVFDLGSTYAMLFSYRSGVDYKSGDGQYRLGLAFSEDLSNWVRADDSLIFDHNQQDWMRSSVSYPSVVTSAKATYVLFQGNEIGRAGIGVSELEIFS